MKYGSNIKFSGEVKGIKKHAKYQWAAHADSRSKDTIFINKYDQIWLKEAGENKIMIRILRRLFGHEPIHCILWDMFGVENDGNYDYLVNRFRKQIQKECPKTHRDYMTF